MLIGLPACTETTAAVCDPVEVEDLDPLSSQHVVPGAEITFLADPPTSGPHLGVPPPSGVIDGPFDLALQVTALESGAVIIHHDGTADLDDLTDLAGDDVLITQSSSLDQPIELTAWQTRQRCDAPDRAAVLAFIRNHAGRTPDH